MFPPAKFERLNENGFSRGKPGNGRHPKHCHEWDRQYLGHYYEIYFCTFLSLCSGCFVARL